MARNDLKSVVANATHYINGDMSDEIILVKGKSYSVIEDVDSGGHFTIIDESKERHTFNIMWLDEFFNTDGADSSTI